MENKEKLLAYLAGVLDSSGTIIMDGGDVEIRLLSDDPRPLERFATAYGGEVTHPEGVAYMLRLTNDKRVLKAINELHGMLTAIRLEALLAYELLANTPPRWMPGGRTKLAHRRKGIQNLWDAMQQQNNSDLNLMAGLEETLENGS
jgi:hypothetical protein